MLVCQPSSDAKAHEQTASQTGGVTWDHIPTPMSDGAGSLDSFHFEANGEVGWIAGGVYYPVKSGNCTNIESIGFLNDTNAWVISKENELVRVSLAPSLIE